MKLSYLWDKETDKNEIESKYLWTLPQNQLSKNIKRINLSNFLNDFSWISDSSIFIKYAKTLPNNQFFGINIDKDNGFQYLFISDENLRMKILETPIKLLSACRYHISCFYDDSIFIFETNFGSSQWDRDKIHCARRYFIKQNLWINLSTMPCNSPTSCIGIKQKIIITTDMPGIWIYDIFLDSYSQHFPIQTLQCWLAEQMLTKFKERVYMINRLSVNEIYCSDDPLSEWTHVCAFKDKLFFRALSTYTFYKGSIYYFNRGTLYKFSLKKFESKAVETK